MQKQGDQRVNIKFPPLIGQIHLLKRFGCKIKLHHLIPWYHAERTVFTSLEIQFRTLRETASKSSFFEGPMILRDVYFSILFSFIFVYQESIGCVAHSQDSRIPTSMRAYIFRPSFANGILGRGPTPKVFLLILPMIFPTQLMAQLGGLGILGIPLSNNPFHFRGSQESKPPFYHSLTNLLFRKPNSLAQFCRRPDSGRCHDVGLAMDC